MQVTHLSFKDSGGAGAAALRLHQGLLACDFKSSMLVVHKSFSDPTIQKVPDKISTAASRYLEHLAHTRIETKRSQVSNTYFSMTHPAHNLAESTLTKESDIIHIHWVAGILAPQQVKAWSESGKKIVITLHDEWFYTGGCHYSSGCEAFLTHCHACPQLTQDPLKLVDHMFQEKLEMLGSSNLTVVAPSQWLASRAAKSKIFSHHRVECIPNSLDENTFKPTAKHEAKLKLQLNPKKKWVIFGADNPLERRKGLAELVQAFLSVAETQPHIVQNLGIISFGGADLSVLSTTGFEIWNAGYLSDPQKLSLIYSAASFLALPSLEDNLPNLMLESLASGTPLVAFPTGGIVDWIQRPYGRLAKNHSVPALAEAIQEMLGDLESSDFSRECRELALHNFAFKSQAKRYIELYKSLPKKSEKASAKNPLSPLEPQAPQLSSMQFLNRLEGSTFKAQAKLTLQNAKDYLAPLVVKLKAKLHEL